MSQTEKFKQPSLLLDMVASCKCCKRVFSGCLQHLYLISYGPHWCRGLAVGFSCTCVVPIASFVVSHSKAKGIALNPLRAGRIQEVKKLLKIVCRPLNLFCGHTQIEKLPYDASRAREWTGYEFPGHGSVCLFGFESVRMGSPSRRLEKFSRKTVCL